MTGIAGASRPAELLQTDRIVPDFGHVFDLSAIKFHVVELQMYQPLPVSSASKILGPVPSSR